MKDLISIDLKSKKVSDAGGMRDRGFTLVELLVTMVVSSIIMAAIYSVYAGLTRGGCFIRAASHQTVKPYLVIMLISTIVVALCVAITIGCTAQGTRRTAQK